MVCDNWCNFKTAIQDIYLRLACVTGVLFSNHICISCTEMPEWNLQVSDSNEHVSKHIHVSSRLFSALSRRTGAILTGEV